MTSHKEEGNNREVIPKQGQTILTELNLKVLKPLTKKASEVSSLKDILVYPTVRGECRDTPIWSTLLGKKMGNSIWWEIDCCKCREIFFWTALPRKGRCSAFGTRKPVSWMLEMFKQEGSICANMWSQFGQCRSPCLLLSQNILFFSFYYITPRLLTVLCCLVLVTWGTCDLPAAFPQHLWGKWGAALYKI